MGVRLEGAAKSLLQSSRRVAWKVKSGWNGNNARIIKRYLSTHEIRALHIGCGNHIINGWLNADLFPWSASLLHLDATEPFPFGAGEFAYIYSEHMIEHISYSEGLHMLSECYRIMRDGGIIRISTPDLKFLIDLYKDQTSASRKDYVKWATNQFIHFAPYEDAIFVINNFMRDWGHQFIYDEKTLAASLERAGFKCIARCELNESRHEVLRLLENEGRMPAGFLKLETMCLEATK